MSLLGSHNASALDSDPNVITARAAYSRAVKSYENASHGYKTKRQYQLQRALHALIQAENAASAKLPKTTPPPAQIEDPKPVQRSLDYMPRESGDDTNYRSKPAKDD